MRLQRYDLNKQLETKLKSIPYDVKGISSIPPEDYKDRFMTFMSKITNS
jgi:hypothetical protein